MTAQDFEMLRMANMCTFPGDFKKDLLKLNIDPQLADDIAYSFRMSRKYDGGYDFLEFLFEYCVGDDSWSAAILIYINSFAKV